MTNAPTRTYPDGVPSWVDTEQPDVESALDFYGGLFGWSFLEATPPGAPFRYVIAQLDGQDVGGIGGPARPPGSQDRGGAGPAWHTYIAVTDADGAAATVLAEGGSVTEPPTDAGEEGRSVVCLDPAGVEFRLWQARRRMGSQVVNAPGAWNFSDLRAPEPDVIADFYTRVFGWAFDDIGFATLIRRPGYGAHLEATVDPDIRKRQSAISAPVGFEDAIGWLAPAQEGETPHWHVTFTVADRDAAVAQAETLGGVVLATDDTEWTFTALIRDPQGAVFTASQFIAG